MATTIKVNGATITLGNNAVKAASSESYDFEDVYAKAVESAIMVDVMNTAVESMAIMSTEGEKLNKFKEGVKKVWEKIAEFFANIARSIQAFFMGTGLKMRAKVILTKYRKNGLTEGWQEKVPYVRFKPDASRDDNFDTDTLKDAERYSLEDRLDMIFDKLTSIQKETSFIIDNKILKIIDDCNEELDPKYKDVRNNIDDVEHEITNVFRSTKYNSFEKLTLGDLAKKFAIGDNNFEQVLKSIISTTHKRIKDGLKLRDAAIKNSKSIQKICTSIKTKWGDYEEENESFSKNQKLIRALCVRNVKICNKYTSCIFGSINFTLKIANMMVTPINKNKF